MKTEEITKDWLVENEYEILASNENWLVAFKNDGDEAQIFIRKRTDKNDEGRFFSLLHDEIAVIYKTIFDYEY